MNAWQNEKETLRHKILTLGNMIIVGKKLLTIVLFFFFFLNLIMLDEKLVSMRLRRHKRQKK